MNKTAGQTFQLFNVIVHIFSHASFIGLNISPVYNNPNKEI